MDWGQVALGDLFLFLFFFIFLFWHLLVSFISLINVNLTMVNNLGPTYNIALS